MEERMLERKKLVVTEEAVAEEELENVNLIKEKTVERVAVKQEGVEYPRWSTVDGKEIMLEELERALMESYRVMDLPCNSKRGKSYRALEKTVRGLEEHVTKLRIDLVGHEVVEVVSVAEETSTLREEVVERDGKRSAINIVAGDTWRALRKASFKAITYPTAGNLSANLQVRLEGLVGRSWYNANRATKTSVVTNFGVYVSSTIGVWAYLNHLQLFDNSGEAVFAFLLHAGLGALWGGLEAEERKGRPSVLGKLVSYPIEGVLSVYDKSRNYVKSVREKVRALA